jgi:hypothetical protein
MKKLFENIEVDDEFYRLRNGKKIHYEKCKVTKINTPDIIVYKIKGRSKNKIRWFKNRNIMLYKSTFFKRKEDLLFHIHSLLNTVSFYSYDDFSDQLLQELDKFKKNKPQYFI